MLLLLSMYNNLHYYCSAMMVERSDFCFNNCCGSTALWIFVILPNVSPQSLKCVEPGFEGYIS